MAFLYPFNQGASSSRGRSASTPSTNYENSPFGSDDAVAASPSRSSRSSLLSDWTSNELTEMEIDPPSRGTPTPQVIIDLTVDDDPPAAQYTAARPAQVQGGGYPRPGTHTSRELDNIYTMISRLQQDQRTHGEGIQGLSTRMGISENNIKGIGEDVQQLSTRMGIAESEFKGVHEGICKLSTRIDNFETRLKEDARNRQKERREDQKHHYRVERNHDIRHGIVIGMLKQRLDLVNQAIGSAGFGSPTSYKYDVPSSDSSQHTHSSSNSSLHQSPSRRAGYEDPRNSKGGRGGAGQRLLTENPQTVYPLNQVRHPKFHNHRKRVKQLRQNISWRERQRNSQ